MKGAIIQPSFLPWRGFFDILYRCDLFVFLDDVQYDKRSWRNRNLIRTPHGVQWITVPVHTKGRYIQSIVETRIDNGMPWRRKALGAIRQNYRRAAYFDPYFDALTRILEAEWPYLADLDIRLVEEVMRHLGIERRVLRSSRLGIAAEEKNARLIAICRQVGIDHYFTGPTTKAYIDEARFRAQGIAVEYVTYDYPPYTQCFGDYVPHVSIVDLLLNHGPSAPQYIWDRH